LIDTPTPDRVRRLVHTAIRRFDERLCATIMQQLSLETRTQLDALLTVGVPEAREETLCVTWSKSTKLAAPATSSRCEMPMRGPYSKHYRRMIPVILKHLAFCSNNEVHQPIIQALDLLKKYVDVPLTQPHFGSSETVPLDEIVPTSWRKAVLTGDKRRRAAQDGL